MTGRRMSPVQWARFLLVSTLLIVVHALAIVGFVAVYYCLAGDCCEVVAQ